MRCPEPVRGLPLARPSIQQRFGVALRQHRQRHGWSQLVLAYEAGLDRSFVGELERGDATASLLTLDKLAQALGLSLAELLEGCDRMPQPPDTQPAGLRAVAHAT